ncbi:leucine-rich repeat-containing protein 43-like isoform X2 [Dysidea avara]|uniref:leucine-rich repeat-containing protein 43-like isoform X2 n=1 Tax=Dysidea avara TaxID=196820 RepID=UPI003326C80E
MSSDQPPDSKISSIISKLITSLYLLTPNTAQKPTEDGAKGVELSSDELGDLSNSVVWRGDDEWSSEVREIRCELLQGKKLSHSEICLRLKTLKLFDKKIKEIDAGLLKYINLKELTLTGNLINHINPDHLPRQLEVLECCYNELSELTDLLSSPPPSLVHLGLSHNTLHCVRFPSHKWSCLLSLDLSNNLLEDLGLIMETLLPLVNLRNLLLMGNPLALVSAYRSYVVDRLPCLSVLDDIAISSDERKLVHGVARKAKNTEFIKKAELELRFDKFTGLPQMILTEDTPEQMIRYYLVVSYQFMPSTQSADNNKTPVDSVVTVSSAAAAAAAVDSKINITSQPQDNASHTSAIRSAPLPYHTRNDCDFSQVHVVSELIGFQEWLQEGLTIKVDLQKATYVRDQVSRPASSKKDKQADKQKSGKKGKLSQLEEPGEDWSSSLLDGTNELNDCLNCNITDSDICGLFQSDAKSATSTEGSVSEVQWSMDVHCMLRKVQTVSDFHKT